MAKSGSLRCGLLILLSFCLVVPKILAGTLTGELDKTEGTLEDQFVYTLSIQGNFDGEPSFPTVDGLQVERSGTSQSVSIINGKFSREVQVQFVISPQRVGAFTIPSLKLKVDKQELQTVPLEFKVLGVPGAGSGGVSGSDTRADRNVFIEREFDRSKIYVGESIVAKLRLFNRVKLYGASPQIPYPSSFQQKSMGDQLNYQRTIQGEDYSVTELRTLLTPTKPGVFEVDPALVEAQVPGARRSGTPRSLLDDMMGGGLRNLETKRFRSEAAKIEVLPLPLAGRRNDFSGLVGSFQMETEVSQRQVKLGDSITVTVHIKGLGATVGMLDPQLAYPGLAKVYRDKPQSQDAVDPDRGLVGDRIYKFAVVPTKLGALDLGALNLQIFDPQTAAYRDMKAELGQIQVEAAGAMAGGAGEGKAPVTGSETKRSQSPKPVAQLAEDLVEPHAESRLQGSDQLEPQEWYLGLGLMAGMTVFLPLIAIRQRLVANSEHRQRRKRQSQALKSFKKQQSTAQRLLEESGPKEAIQHARQNFHGYLADKLAVKASSMTARDLALCLAGKGVDGQTIGAVEEIWRQMDQMLYAREAPAGDVSRALLDRMNQVVGEVDHRC